MNKPFFKRSRIEDALSKISIDPLTILTAPAGYGKTTAVMSQIVSRGFHPICISFSRFDKNINLFWHHFCKQVKKESIRVGQKLAALGFPVNVPQKENVLQILEKFFYKKNRILVIDNYDFVCCDAINEFIEFLVVAQIPDLHIILILDLATLPFNLSSKILPFCHLIDPSVFTIHAEEAFEYTQQFFVLIDIQSAKNIAIRSNGCITTLVLLMQYFHLSGKLSSFTDISNITEDLLGILFKKEEHELLLVMSVLGSFSITQYQALTKSSDISYTLKQLVSQLPLITYNSHTDQYILHRLFLDFLQTKWDNHLGEVRSLLKCAGILYFKKRDLFRASDCFISANDFESFLSLLNHEDALDFSYDSWLGLNHKFLSQPHTLWIQYPMVYLQFACYAVLNGNHELLKSGTQILEVLKHYYQNSVEETSEFCTHILAEIEIVSIFSDFNKVDQMLVHADKACALLDGKTSQIKFPKHRMNFACPHFSYSYYYKIGNFKDTVFSIAQNFMRITWVTNGYGTGCDIQVSAERALELCGCSAHGELTSAALMAYQAKACANENNQLFLSVCSEFTIMRICLLQGRLKEMAQRLFELYRTVESENNALLNTSLDLCRGYLYSCAGNNELVPHWLRNGDLCADNLMIEGSGLQYIIYQKTLMLDSKWEQLEAECKSFKKINTLHNNQLGSFHNYIHSSVAKYHLYGVDEAKKEIKQALIIGRSEGLVLPFIENSPYIIPIIQSLCAEQKSAYRQEILNYCIKYQHHYASHLEVNYALSRREFEIFKQLQSGLKPESIAKKLCVSPSTINKHKENIFQKLGIKNIQQAARLNFLS